MNARTETGKITVIKMQDIKTVKLKLKKNKRMMALGRICKQSGDLIITADGYGILLHLYLCSMLDNFHKIVKNDN